MRTRDPEKLASCDIVVDVGGEYDPQRHRYDHHQRWVPTTISLTFLDSSVLQSTAVVRVSEGNRLILESKLLSPMELPSSVLPALHLLCTHLAGLGPPLARVSPWAPSNSPPSLAQSGFSPTSPIVTPVNTAAGINPVMCPCCPTSDCWAHTIVVGGDS